MSLEIFCPLIFNTLGDIDSQISLHLCVVNALMPRSILSLSNIC